MLALGRNNGQQNETANSAMFSRIALPVAYLLARCAAEQTEKKGIFAAQMPSKALIHLVGR